MKTPHTLSARRLPFLLLLLPALSVLPARAQLAEGDAMAETVLQNTVALLTRHGGVSAEVDITYFRNLEIASETSGTLRMQDGKFYLKSTQGEIWYDGENEWTLIEGSGEVTLTRPTQEELQQVNPYAFISLYRQGYSAELFPTSYSGNPAHEVRLKTQRDDNIEEIRLVVDKKSFTPYSVRAMVGEGSWIRLRLSAFKTGENFPESDFRFQAAAHPGVSVIDLR